MLLQLCITPWGVHYLSLRDSACAPFQHDADGRSPLGCARSQLQRHQGNYALGIQFGGKVHHFKVYKQGLMALFELASDGEAFHTLKDLVRHYTDHSLHRHFSAMRTTLQTPYRA